MKRLLPAGLGASGIRTMWVLGLLGALKAVALVMMAEAVARGTVGAIEGTDAWRGALIFGIGAAVLRASVVWATAVVAARAAIGTKERLRHDLAERAMTGGTGSVGSLVTLATRGLDDLDHYFSKVLPAVATVGAVPLLVGARILFTDWVSAVVIIVTVPLIPVFMALIGMQTAERVTASSAALARLSDHLVELARGLPVLVGLGRVDEQSAALDQISSRYRARTMATLRTAFMSSLALELIATISVAVVAVFIGFRLVDGSLPLETGLLVLILAPECYAPFREVGAAFHSASDGVAAVNRARAVIVTPVEESVVSSAGVSPVVVRGLTVTRTDRGVIVDHLDLDLPARGVTAIAGASGRGKSTVLTVLAGRLSSAEGVVVGGCVRGISPAHIALAPQHPVAVASSCAEELRIYGAADASELLSRFDLSAVAECDPAQLSPGELRRLAIARVIARVQCGATLVLLDEPTAHLDAEHARVVEREIAAIASVASVVVASHEPSVVALADQVLWLGEGGVNSVTSVFEVASVAEVLSVFEVASVAQRTSAALPGSVAEPVAAWDASLDSVAAGRERQEGPYAPRVDAPQLRTLLRILGPTTPRLLLAVVLGLSAALFAVALTAVSGWLIVRASQHPAIMYLLVAIVGVRFFGIARSVARYAERLVTHDAVFRSIGILRSRLWARFAALGPGSRILAQGGRALDYLVSAADEIRDLVPRVVIPPLVAIATSAAALITFAWLAPSTMSALAGCLAVSLFVAPAIALWADRRAGRAGFAARSEMIRSFAAMLHASDDLRANGVDGPVRQQFDRLDARAGMLARRGSSALGLGSAIVVAMGGLGAMLVLMASASALASGLIAPELVAVLVLIPLALVDPLLGAVDSVQQWPTLRAALQRVGELEVVQGAAGNIRLAEVSTLQLDDLAAAWPGTSRLAVSGVSATVKRGDWVVVSGESGSGKTTLLSVLLGHIPVASGSYRLDSVDARDVLPDDLRRLVAWCPQESHLFNSTLRANLLLGRARDDAPTDVELLDAVARAGLGQFLSRLPKGLDTRIGSAGSSLSGGERQRVAVARTLLTRADVVLLDEPTAHLDAPTADELMRDLRMAFADRIVVLVTHHVDETRPGDHLLRLGSRRLHRVNFA